MHYTEHHMFIQTNQQSNSLQIMLKADDRLFQGYYSPNVSLYFCGGRLLVNHKLPVLLFCPTIPDASSRIVLILVVFKYKIIIHQLPLCTVIAASQPIKANETQFIGWTVTPTNNQSTHSIRIKLIPMANCDCKTSLLAGMK